MPTYGQEVKSAQVKLVSVQMPDSAQIGVPFKMTVSAQVTNSDSPKGGITISFSKPVKIKIPSSSASAKVYPNKIPSSSASAKVYPKGSKIWNKNLKANMVSKYTMAELWVERWRKEMVHQLSLDVTPLEAGDLDVFIRATAIDATSGENVNAPKEGVVDQQGFPCEKRTLRIKNQQTSLAGAELGVWTPKNNGLWGENVQALAISPDGSAIYAGTPNGVYRSTNGGDDWTQINRGLTALDVQALAINPQNPETIYAGTSGVYRSTNGGDDWTEINKGLTYLNVSALAINPQNPETIYAAGSRVYRSTNGGDDWMQINSGLTNTHVSVLAINPQNPETIYAGTWDGVVYRSCCC
jgi:photosystem II stability/assembly factor-like uncharacterized protein